MMFSIVLPQALRNITPQIGNTLVANIKDTSLLSAVSYTHLDCSAEDEDYVLSRLTGQFSGESLEHYNQNGFWTRVIPDLQNARKRCV